MNLPNEGQCDVIYTELINPSYERKASKHENK